MVMTETMALETIHEIKLVLVISQPVTFVKILPFISLHLTLTEVKILDNATRKYIGRIWTQMLMPQCV